jgi:ATP-binding cassette subfamily C protein
MADEPTAPERASSIQPYVTFIRFLRAEAGVSLIFALLFLVLGGLSESLSILLLIPIIKQVSASQSGGMFGSTLPFLGPWFEQLVGNFERSLIIFTGMVVARAWLVRRKDLYLSDLLYSVVNKLQNQLFSSITSAEWMKIASFRASDLNHAMTVDVSRVQLIVFQSITLLQNIVMLIFYTIISCMVSVPMTAIAVGMGVAVIVMVLPLSRRVDGLGRQVTIERADQTRTVSDFLSGVKLAKTMNAEQTYVTKLDERLESLKLLALEFVKIQNISNFSFQASAAIGLSLFAYVGISNFNVPIEQLIVLILLVSRISPQFNGIQGAFQSIVANMHAFTNMTEIKALCEAARETPSAKKSAFELQRELVLSEVSVVYPGQTKPALKSVDLRLAAGRVIAVIGPSGGGKSTLADVLIGLVEPTSGVMAVDGVPVAVASRRAWRDEIAYVSQDVFMLNDTILKNLRFGAAYADEAAAWRALEMAQAKAFVERLPNGLHTEIGERGFRLSGGERQRIALARALMREPQLLVLDEATSALDWQSQSLVAQAISNLRGRMTIVTIAHRPSMIAFADDVIVIRDGEVVETGRYDDLKADPRSHLKTMLSAEGAGVE